MATLPTAPIFIVGVPRSGTTKIAAMLGAHSRLSCGPETHIFARLTQERADDLLGRARWAEEAADYLCAICAAGNAPAAPVRYAINRPEIVQFLQDRPPSLHNLVAALTETYMRQQGKQRWIEKTPRHLRKVALIRRHFPDSPILHIVRDPRDVALSLVKVPWGPRTLKDALLRWRKDERAVAAFFQADRNSLTVPFERVVADPAGECERICRFLGETFEPAMLDTSISARKISTASIVAHAAQAMRPDRIGVWRREMAPRDIALASWLLGPELVKYGYEPHGSCPRWRAVGQLIKQALDRSVVRCDANASHVFRQLFHVTL